MSIKKIALAVVCGCLFVALGWPRQFSGLFTEPRFRCTCGGHSGVDASPASWAGQTNWFILKCRDCGKKWDVYDVGFSDVADALHQ